MVKLLHTADWQMGMKVLLVGGKGKEVRDKRYETLSRVVDLAKREHVDFVLLAGDVFEDNDVDESTVKRTVDTLNRLKPIQVFVIPGNHDPLVPGSIWNRHSWKRVDDHVHLMQESQEVDLGGKVALYPCPLKQKQSQLDPTAWIPARGQGDSRIRIGVAHGSLDVLPGNVNFPIDSKRAELSNLDYLALGDWHSFVQKGRAVYPGTIEPTCFTEQDPGNAVIVDIPGPGKNPTIQKQRVSSLTWIDASLTIRDETDVEKLDSDIQNSVASVSNLITRVTISYGPNVSPATRERLGALRQQLEECAFFLDWSEPTAPGIGTTASSLPEGVLKLVDEALSAIKEGRIPDGPGKTYAAEDPATVDEARALLRTLARGDNS